MRRGTGDEKGGRTLNGRLKTVSRLKSRVLPLVSCLLSLVLPLTLFAAPGAGPKAQAIINFLHKIEGKYIIAGQQCDYGLDGVEVIAIQKTTGQTPLMIGFDFLQRSPGRIAHGADQDPAAVAIECAKEGCWIEFSWHWCLKDEFMKPGDEDENGRPRWWGAFYAFNSAISLEDIMAGRDKAGRKMLIEDIDFIAQDLKRLKEAGVVVFWRPLHEAGGKWFWWGAEGPENFKKLWKIMYKRLVFHHKLDNLIWVYTGWAGDWYPGDEWVDIMGDDIYLKPDDFDPQKGRYDQTRGELAKPTAMTELGGHFDIDKAFEEGVNWIWFLEWVGGWKQEDGEWKSAHSPEEIWRKVYNHPKVLTLERFQEKVEKRKAKKLAEAAKNKKAKKSAALPATNTRKVRK